MLEMDRLDGLGGRLGASVSNRLQHRIGFSLP